MLDNYKALKSRLRADISYYSQWDELFRDAQPSDSAYDDERQKLQAELEVEQEQAFTPGLHSDAMERSFALIVKLKRRIEELDNAHTLTMEKNEAQMKTLRAYIKKLHDRIGDSMSKLPPVSPSTSQPTSRGSPILGDLDLSGMDGVEPPQHVDETVSNPLSETCRASPDNFQEAQPLDRATPSLSVPSPSRSSRPQSPVLPADQLPAVTPMQTWKRPRKDQAAVEDVKVKDEGQADDVESTHSAKRPRVHVDKENVEGKDSSQPDPSDEARKIDFEDVFQNGGGEYRHFIIEDPYNTGKFYIFMCEEHGVHFNSDALKCAGRHLDTKGHGSQPRGAANAIKVLGIEVLNCNAALAKKNNTALAAAIKNGKYTVFRRTVLDPFAQDQHPLSACGLAGLKQRRSASIHHTSKSPSQGTRIEKPSPYDFPGLDTRQNRSEPRFELHPKGRRTSGVDISAKNGRLTARPLYSFDSTRLLTP